MNAWGLHFGGLVGLVLWAATHSGEFNPWAGLMGMFAVWIAYEP